MPQNPESDSRIMNSTSEPITFMRNMNSPQHVTATICIIISTNSLTTCDVSTSTGLTPITRDLSSMPSLRSTNIATAVNAAARKNAIVISTPGVANSVKSVSTVP
uniref:Uncharacterized protein n=1 Tax=Photinus pyralis TaxID=7054 RepID=A0A1Y1LXP7_PHOPY